LSFITLLTDFGNRDFYTGALKGTLLRHCPDATLIDISHDIEPYNILHAAFVARNVWADFPEGTVHILAVNCAYDAAYRFVLLRHAGHYFMAPDNGLLRLIFEQSPPPHEVRLLSGNNEQKASVRHTFAEAAGRLLSGQPFETIGSFAPPLLERIGLRAVVTGQRIRGTVIHIDNYGNVVVNITKELLESTGKGRPFALYFRRHDPITRLSTNYCDVAPGEPLCLFNGAGYLEIAINMDRAATLLGLKVEDVVEMAFE
jgi:S-adenosylmethionine hydrolase